MRVCAQDGWVFLDVRPPTEVAKVNNIRGMRSSGNAAVWPVQTAAPWLNRWDMHEA